jgi:hypothetical protein
MQPDQANTFASTGVALAHRVPAEGGEARQNELAFTGMRGSA